jgi:hypothetical protein
VTAPALTVFTATVYGDVVRLWRACVARALGDAARIEIFDDSPGQDLDPALLPEAEILRRSPARRDFHEAYNDAVRRCETPLLAFVDSDVFWLDPGAWRRAAAEMADPRVAAVSCVSRTKTESHGTFAVVMRTEDYRRALARLPGGFFPAIAKLDPAIPKERWTWHDTGDLMTREVVSSGSEVRLLNLERSAEFARFDGITLSRRAALWMGGAALARISAENDYFWHGWIGNATLKSLHDAAFPDGPRYDFPFSRTRALALTAAGGLRTARSRLRYLTQTARQAREVRRALDGAATR